METEKKINRTIFENAISSMEKLGPESMMNPRVFSKREDIQNCLLQYYESTEEYEKCKFIINFFRELESLSSLDKTQGLQNNK